MAAAEGLPPAQGLPAAIRATERSRHFQELMILIRSRTDATAKGLAAVGTAAVTAIGYAKLADVFPYHGPVWALVTLGAGIIAMVAAVVFLVRRFEKIGRTIITHSDVSRTRKENGLEKKEVKLLKKQYRHRAELNEVESLHAYKARAYRFERIADRTGDAATATDLRSRADVIRAEVQATEDRAVVYLLRDRARRAFFSWTAVLLLVLFLVGWYGAAVSADKLAASRVAATKSSSS